MLQVQETFAELFSQSKILVDEPLSNYTNTKTGGPAELLAFPREYDEIKAMVFTANKMKLPLTVIGNASNLIVRDGGIRGLVIILSKMNSIKVQHDKVIAAAGASMIDTTECAYHSGLSGLEFAAGIPGSIGGAIFMNAGAYGGEVCEVVERVDVLTKAGEIKSYPKEKMNFSYRHSRIQDTGEIVLAATFSLKQDDKKVIRTKMDEVNFLRASKQPLEYPSCGSVFKRPAGHYTGKLIHDAKLQGFQVGGAQISLKHAGFIVNRGNATASDYLAVIEHVQKCVQKLFDVTLETEVRIIGEKK
ncbi:UDP-N-acetylmuramate dehydrogenase [Liquorilactobacillus oeni]|uniref:UDP-N-acetylenolpyruvoylglucosamine reductase n=1 Tax=Liquorilactobacillus oeni DSM 19972 TaxID=1423777 RepID=A0A0R1M7M2_9LACO|nr:UDP-N-acetylmuramate dehydrogenase [Liquorilactobacillus oeni]KRL03921.1 UDP-N-acetylenolpyruvoylglucosamine reductase [Liquorilactobacillus oeni DSM 19972]